MAVADQLAEFCQLKSGRIDTNLPGIRDDQPDRLYATVEHKQAALVEYVRALHETGRPILLGTLSVAESERIAHELSKVGVDGIVLNAKNDAEEATIIARAGERGRVTISAQMAGRGTDIRLGAPDGADRDQVAALGGLCVVGSGRYHTNRLDDQLRGRAGRQGDPGTSVLFTSLCDDLVSRYVPDAKHHKLVDPDGRVHDEHVQQTVEHAQRVAEGAHLDIHRNTWRYHQLINLQRTTVLEHRDQVLHAGLAAQRLQHLCAKRYSQLRDTVSDDVLATAARLIVLYHLDRCWTEHLAYLTDIREGIHLRALGLETPVDEFHRIAIAEFSQFFTSAYQRCADTFTHASITADGIDLEPLGLKRPTSTWTYLITDNPFGTPEERFLQFFGTIIRDSTVKIGVRD